MKFVVEKMNKIAVIVCVYHNDRLEYLQEALQSLYEQSLGADIFVQQDGCVSEDVALYLDDELQKKKVVYVGKRSENRGLAHSLNELLEVVLKRGYAYIARMDADDISLPQRFQRQYDFMQKNAEIDVVGGYIEEFSDELAYRKVVCYPLTHDEMFRFFSRRVPLAHVSAFFRRSFFEKVGLYPTTSPTNEDTLLWMEGFKVGCRFANIPEVVVRVRVSAAFFDRRGGVKKAWNDLQDRVQVIKTLRYNKSSYLYALALFIVNVAPPKIKQFLYKRLR